eukprot:2775583-Rhodomonas_salina.1
MLTKSVPSSPGSHGSRLLGSCVGRPLAQRRDTAAASAVWGRYYCWVFRSRSHDWHSGTGTGSGMSPNS